MSSELLKTVTVSAIWPTSSVRGMLTGWPGATLTFFDTAVLKPASDAVTVYDPAPSALIWYSPSLLLVASSELPVVSSVTTTVAPGIKPPAESLTTPEIDAVDCADEDVLHTTSRAIAHNDATHKRVLIKAPPPPRKPGTSTHRHERGRRNRIPLSEYRSWIE